MERRWGFGVLVVALVACGDGGGAEEGAPQEDVGQEVGQDVAEEVTDSGGEDVAAELDVADEAEVVEGACEVVWAPTLPGGASGVEVFAYEASRVDATASSAGQDGASVCSRAGVLPWTGITWEEAVARCASIGARLCEGSEWDDGCNGGSAASYPYGSAYDAAACNVLEGPDGCLTGTCRLVPTGSYGRCQSPVGAWDMSGNASEWVATPRSFGDVVFEVRGGSYTSANDATIRCRNAHFWQPATYSDPMLGFRCCRDAAR